MKSIIKTILKFLGYELTKYNSDIYRINSQHFIPIQKKDRDWKINLEGFKRSKIFMMIFSLRLDFIL